MTREEFKQSIKNTYKKGMGIIEIKNDDYANSENPFKNFESAKVIGLGVEEAILIRILDKLARIGNLIHKEASVKDESLEDTIVDACNYLAILKAYRERK